MIGSHARTVPPPNTPSTLPSNKGPVLFVPHSCSNQRIVLLHVAGPGRSRFCKVVVSETISPGEVSSLLLCGRNPRNHTHDHRKRHGDHCNSSLGCFLHCCRDLSCSQLLHCQQHLPPALPAQQLKKPLSNGEPHPDPEQPVAPSVPPPSGDFTPTASAAEDSEMHWTTWPRSGSGAEPAAPGPCTPPPPGALAICKGHPPVRTTTGHMPNKLHTISASQSLAV
ncbi:uncharacterized protein LOC133114200 [Conger conger]|uniref:uncharacterized protein LOC133114200 n=1 Tax=Conger conger TaxID=82655 RepID=UPI002A59D684|nr:uncharacterized protein LOC133114200 [Conger conger]